MSERIPVEFTCPTCGEHRMEEVMVDITVSSVITLTQNSDGSDPDFEYGQQSNEDGHVERYQCIGCGYTIVADTPEFARFTEDGLDHNSLAKALRVLNADGVALITHGELVRRFADALDSTEGEALARIWNESSPNQVVYKGDSIFEWVEE